MLEKAPETCHFLPLFRLLRMIPTRLDSIGKSFSAEEIGNATGHCWAT
jgi:hypothetical protein